MSFPYIFIEVTNTYSIDSQQLDKRLQNTNWFFMLIYSILWWPIQSFLMNCLNPMYSLLFKPFWLPSPKDLVYTPCLPLCSQNSFCLRKTSRFSFTVYHDFISSKRRLYKMFYAMCDYHVIFLFKTWEF